VRDNERSLMTNSSTDIRNCAFGF